ncbi:MAG: TolC family protein [Bacteriovoracaceae bacterium]
MKFLILLLSLASVARASSLEDVIRSAWEKDQLIKAQESRISAADLDKYARFLPNNPNVAYSDMDNSSWHIYGGTLDIGIPGKAFALRKLDNARYEAEKSELAAKKNELAQFILDRYSECAAGKELIRILTSATNELESLTRALTARYETGQTTQAERIGMELQYRQAKIEYDAIIDRSRIACGKLQELSERYDLTINEETLLLPDDFNQATISQLGNASIDYIRSSNDLRIADARYKTASWDVLPNFTLGYYRQYYNRVVASPIIPTQWTTSYTVSVNLPIFYWFYNGNDLRKIRAENMITERRAQMRKLQSEVDINNARTLFIRNRKILTRLRQHDLPMAETMVDSTLANYKAGKLGFSELILARRTWLDLKKEEVSLKQSLLNARLICLSSCEMETL